MVSVETNAPSARRNAFLVVLAIEFWERFGFYGMQAVLTVFMVRQLKLDDVRINMLLGASSALIYIMPVLGGLVGDRLLGARRSMVLGALGLTAGYCSLAVGQASVSGLMFGLALIAVGNGLFKPNAGNLVRRIYAGDDSALDAVFTLYYMSVNVGSSISMLMMPWLDDRFGFHVAFGACALGLIVGLIYYAFRARRLNDTALASEPGRRSAAFMAFFAVSFGMTVAFCVWILSNERLAQIGIGLAVLLLIGLWGRFYAKASPPEKAALRVAYILSIFGALYLVYYQQSITSLTLFAIRGVAPVFTIGHVALFRLSPGQFQALNPLWVMALSPLLALFYHRQGKRGRDLSIHIKMLIGYAGLFLAFLLWWQAAAHATGPVSPWIMVGGYGLMSLAELLTSGLALAVVARYVPAAFGGVVSGTVYLLWGVAMYAGSLLANRVALPSGGASVGGAEGALLYAPLFKQLCFSSGGIFLLGLIVPPLVARYSSLREMA